MRCAVGPAEENQSLQKPSNISMKPSERVNRFVNSRRLVRMTEGNEAAHPHNVSSFIRDEETAAYISKLLEIIDEQHERIAKLERQPALVSYPRSTLVKPAGRSERAGKRSPETPTAAGILTRLVPANAPF